MSWNVGLHLGVSQSEVICTTAYGKFFTGVTPEDEEDVLPHK